MSRKKEIVYGEKIYPLAGFKELLKRFTSNYYDKPEEDLSNKNAEKEAREIAKLSEKRIQQLESKYSGGVNGSRDSGKKKIAPSYKSNENTTRGNEEAIEYDDEDRER